MKLKFKWNKKTIILAIIGVLILALLIVGLCFLLKKDPKDQKKDEVIPKEGAIVNKINIVDPNTTSRPFAIMINNISTARPLQSGLQDAYIIYEMIVEGGITRYLALFLDQDTARIGSVRSSRHYYLDYALENDAIYVHHGQSPQALSDFGTLGIDRVVVDESKTGWRDKSLKVSSEHTLFTSINKLKNGISKLRQERKKDLLLDYSVDEIDLQNLEGTIPANSISIKYSKGTTSSYEYDSELKVYKRFVNNKEHKDYVTGKQYTFKNIITYQVDNYTIDDYGRQDLRNIGSGEGYYISNGYATLITWEKSSRDSQTIYKYKATGEELVVNDGNTFIQIQPKGQTLSIS